MRRAVLGVLSVLPALVVLALSAFEDTLLRAAGAGTAPPAAVVATVLAVMAGGLAVVLAFMVWAVRAEGRGGAWKLTWVVALGTAGALAAPAFWVLHVRRSGSLHPAPSAGVGGGAVCP